MMERRSTYKNRTNNCGFLSAKISDPDVIDGIKNYCQMTKTSVSVFVEGCCKKYLEEEQKELLNSLSKEELINLILKKKGE